MKSLDIRSESAVKLLSEFLDMDRLYAEGSPHPNAEHFAHEMYSYLRSPFRDLYVYDKMVQYEEPGDFPMGCRQGTQRDDMGITSRRLSPSRHNNTTLPRRPDGNREGDRPQESRRMPCERKPKRSRSGSRDRARVQPPREPSTDEHASRREESEVQINVGSSGTSLPSRNSRLVKGKGKAVDLGGVGSGLGPSTAGSETERATIDKGAVSARDRKPPNAEHTVIVDSKRGRRDRAPKVLTLRQSVQAHLALQKTELLKVSRSPDEPESRPPGPALRHGHPTLFERISGMEEIPDSQPASGTTAATDASTSSSLPRPLLPVVIRPQRSAGTNSETNPTGEVAIDIDNQRLDPISNITPKNDPTVHADCPDRALRVDTDDVLERTRVRLAKMKNIMVAGVPPTAPTPPPLPTDSSMPADPEETISAIPAVANLRCKLLEKLESERDRAIGAASGELKVERAARSISEDSLKAELRARNRLRARLVVTKGDRHADISET